MAKHRSGKQDGSPITKNMRFAASFRLLFLYFNVLFRSALPYFVTGWQIVRFKIAASGARALLAMTNLIGFAEKRNKFRNKTFERRCGAIPRKKQPQKTTAKNNRKKWKTSVFQIKTPRFCVIARPQRGRGNLKAEGMASRGEAREHEARGNPYHKKQEVCCIVSRPLSLF